MDISIVIAAYNEQDNVRELHKKISEVMNSLKKFVGAIIIKNFEQLMTKVKERKNKTVVIAAAHTK